MDPGIELSIDWLDDELLCVRVCASNGRFAGMTHIYILPREFSNIVAGFRGFPANAQDRREIVLGTFTAGWAGGGVVFRLSTDAAGHCSVEVQLRADSSGGGRHEAAEFAIPVEPAQMDRFAAALARMQIGVGATVRLDPEH